jgi:CRISPR-associated protein Csb2
MIAIKMRFPAGRFHATPWGRHVNEGVVEYPPSLWRFLRSLVAVFYRTAPDNVTEESLRRILDALSGAPEFCLPKASVAHTRHYDQANSSVKFFDTFVSLNPEDEIVWIWRDAELDETDRANLAKLLRNLGTFGRSESWCEAELTEDLSKEPNSKPVSGGGFTLKKETIRLLLPKENDAGLFETLTVETSKMRKEKHLDPDGSRWVTYERDADLLTPRRIAPKRKIEPGKITAARFALTANILPLVTKSLPFAELARRCLIRNRGFLTEHSEVITGKRIDGTPLANHQHAHYIVTDEDGDGRIDHLTIYAPRGFDPNDLEAITRMSFINWQSSRAGSDRPDDKKYGCDRTGVRLILQGLGTAETFAAPDKKIALFQKSRVFRSVTPFSLPNFPTRGGGKPPRFKDTPEGQLRRELRKRDLPEPVKVTPTGGFFAKLEPIENIAGAAPRFRWLEFTHRRFKGDCGNGLAGFEIEFAEEDLEKLETPLTLGFGSHFGLGLFLPVK